MDDQVHLGVHAQVQEHDIKLGQEIGPTCSFSILHKTEALDIFH